MPKRKGRAFANEAPNLKRFRDDVTDLVYEGGLKIWECAVDLARHVEREHVEGKCVLELGCGAGK